MNATTNEVAIESIEICVEKVELVYGWMRSLAPGVY